VDEPIRRAYLDALGVEVWTHRSASAPAVVSMSPAAGPVAEAGRAVGEMSWEELRAAVGSCRACDLRDGCTQTVFGVGDEAARWLVIGEAPGADEDRLGEPFVGRAGQLLNAMLASIGLARTEVFIANILKCRPPGNRDPRPGEAAACEPYLRRQIALVQPRIILAVGRIAAQNLLKTETPIGRMRGRSYRYGVDAIPVVVTYHPAYLLRSPAEKRKAYDDLLFAQSVLAGRA
jgi:DNA polymerase